MAVRSNFSGNSVLRIAVLLCLFESFVYILFALVGIQIFRCKTDCASLAKNPEDLNWWKKVSLLVYTTYFKVCKSTEPADSLDELHLRQASVVLRTHNWILIYLMLSGLWMLSSLFLSCAVVARNRISATIRLYLCYPWVLITIIMILTDTFATVQYSLDLLIATGNHPKSMYFQDVIGKELLDTSSPNEVYYIPPIAMSFIFSRGGVFWILNVVFIILVVRFLKSRAAKELKESKSTLATNKISTEDDQSHISTVTSVLSLPPAVRAEYVPWMNVLYVPSSYDDFGENAERVTAEPNDEHGYEHHYERVTCPSDMPNTINIEVPPAIKTDPQLYRMAGYYNNLSPTEPRLLNIDCGSISIHINRKTPNTLALSSSHLTIPRIQVAQLKPKCVFANCNIHNNSSFDNPIP